MGRGTMRSMVVGQSALLAPPPACSRSPSPSPLATGRKESEARFESHPDARILPGDARQVGVDIAEADLGIRQPLDPDVVADAQRPVPIAPVLAPILMPRLRR